MHLRVVRASASSILILAFVLTVSPAVAILTDPINTGAITARLTPFVTIPSTDGSPQDLESANDGTGRLFVSTRNGRVRTVDANGNLSATTFLNLTSSPANISMFLTGEGGFASIAFSPNYLTSGKFYTWTTETYNAASVVDFSHPEMLPAAGGITPSNHILIREWTVNGSPATATTADASSSRVIMRINHPQNNHQGGAMKFGPDGMLYIGLGDGGGGNDNSGGIGSNDGHTNAAGNGQDTTNVFGKILRIDVSGNNSPNPPYTIPTGNAFPGGNGGLKEIYSYGMRNPYRFSFDSQTGHLFVGDVGQDFREEVDDITAGGTANYGWPYREGSATNSNWTTPQNFVSVAPIAEYHNSAPNNGGGNSIIGGYVYRGSLMPQLFGKYVFGDLSGSPGGFGKIFYTDPASGGNIFELKYDLTNGGASPISISGKLYSFGEDANHELYAMFDNGQILRFVPEPTGAILAVFGLPFLLARRASRSSRDRHFD